MTLKRFILGVLTIFAVGILGLSLAESWNQPQIQSRLELFQTNLILHASEWQGPEADTISNFDQARQTLLGNDPIKTALEQYTEKRQSAQTSLNRVQSDLQTLKPEPKASPSTDAIPQAPLTASSSALPQQKQLQQSQRRLEILLDELDLRIGILQAKQNQPQTALQTWTTLIDRSVGLEGTTAEVLAGIWSPSPRLLPTAEAQIRKHLDGWFRYQALEQLYQLQQRQDSLLELRGAEQAIAQQSFLKLLLVGSIPVLGFLGGTGLLIFLVGQRLVRGKEALLAKNGELVWSTPWTGETVWQVFILGFFLVGQVAIPYLLLPVSFRLLHLNPATFDERTRAFSILVSYSLLAIAGLLILYWSLRSFLPLPEGWFQLKWRGKWWLWGLGGYLVALPLVILVSLLNQQLWQGQGGSNPILQIALEGKDRVAIAIFFLTTSVAAPLFEEFMFRGFLLPSLTRYMSVSGAIVVSSLLFAVAHLSLSEILPLATLGMILGFVYTRSRNLLAPMLLHSLWNSGTLLSLFILGSGSS